MIHLTRESLLLMYSKPVDFRKGIDSLVLLCETELKDNPRSGKLFVFLNRDKTKLRILVYEINGYWLMTKRLSVGKFDINSGELDVSSFRKLLCN